MTPREELQALRRLAELEAKAGGGAARNMGGERKDEGGVGSYIDNLGRQFAGGSVANLADEFSAKMTELTGIGPAYVEGGDNSYEAILQRERGRDKAFQSENPGSALAANIGGGIAATVATPVARLATPAAGASLAARSGQSALVGAGMGGAYGFGAGEDGFANRAVDAAKGAVLGGVLGGVTPGIVDGVAAAGRKLAQPVLDRLGPDKAGARRIVQALERDGMTPDQLSARLDELGPDAAIANAGGANVKGLAEVIAQTPGKGMQAAQKTLYGQAEAAPGRAIDAVNRGLSGRDAIAAADDLMKQRSMDARPLYDEAFQGGSTAPLKSQLERAFDEVVSSEGAASRALQTAQRNMTLARAGVQRTGNDVYAANQALAAERQAAAQMQAAEKALADVRGQKSMVLERLRLAQTDAATGAPGAVWSPRIQQFLDDPIAKAGLAKGMEVQRLEALAAGRRFDPTELAITGMDDAGNPIVSGVPNLRTLDAVKRGLDEIINSARSDVTGQVQWNERLRAVDQVRRALVGQLDDLTGGAEGAYAQARSAWAGPSQGLDALARGRNFNSVDPRILQKTVAGMSDGERELFRSGVADKVREMVSRAQDGADVTRRIFGNDRMRQQLQAAFQDEASYQAFSQEMQSLAGFARDKNQILGNSRTSFRDAAREELGFDPSGAVAHGLMGNFGSAIGDAARAGMRYLNRPPKSVVEQLADALFTPGGAAGNAQTLNALTQRGTAMQMSDQQRQALARILAQSGGIEAGTLSGAR